MSSLLQWRRPRIERSVWEWEGELLTGSSSRLQQTEYKCLAERLRSLRSGALNAIIKMEEMHMNLCLGYLDGNERGDAGTCVKSPALQ